MTTESLKCVVFPVKKKGKKEKKKGEPPVLMEDQVEKGR